MSIVTRSLLVALFAIGSAQAQQPATQAAPAAGAPPTAKSLGLVVFPAKDQGADVQAADEAYCMTWAKEQTGIDPAAPAAPPPPKPEKQSGGAVKGAVRGAVAGTAIGAVAGDTGKGAAVGATAGALGGVARQKAANEAAQKQAQQQAAAATQTQMDQFKKAAAACLEGKGYTVK